MCGRSHSSALSWVEGRRPSATFGATGGIYIAGGILLRFKEAFASSPFRERFERKGPFAGMLAKIPTCLILEKSPTAHLNRLPALAMGGAYSSLNHIVTTVVIV